MNKTEPKQAKIAYKLKQRTDHYLIKAHFTTTTPEALIKFFINDPQFDYDVAYQLQQISPTEVKLEGGTDIYIHEKGKKQIKSNIAPFSAYKIEYKWLNYRYYPITFCYDFDINKVKTKTKSQKQPHP